MKSTKVTWVVLSTMLALNAYGQEKPGGTGTGGEPELWEAGMAEAPVPEDIQHQDLDLIAGYRYAAGTKQKLEPILGAKKTQSTHGGSLGVRARVLKLSGTGAVKDISGTATVDFGQGASVGTSVQAFVGGGSTFPGNRRPQDGCAGFVFGGGEADARVHSNSPQRNYGIIGGLGGVGLLCAVGKTVVTLAPVLSQGFGNGGYVIGGGGRMRLDSKRLSLEASSGARATIVMVGDGGARLETFTRASADVNLTNAISVGAQVTQRDSKYYYDDGHSSDPVNTGEKTVGGSETTVGVHIGGSFSAL